jgi:lipopolysaccharide transport system ATP-binding protein
MAEPRIVFDRVWKKFHRGEIHDSLRDLIPATMRRFSGRGTKSDDLAQGDFWALHDLSFDVRPGKTLGIIGMNGSGKSTSLKLLSKILRPTRGSCEVVGRIGALIEISAGFHQDLTGRENVFLQGAIMGMTNRDIARKFDDIVDFSGISEFIDTPVKRYSSGMAARLGFSVAAHLDPDVLLIDEVLAVGDFRFQERAYGRIRDMAKSGIPVVIVSHQLDRIAELCNEAILLDHGRLTFRGSASDCIGAYIELKPTEAVADGEAPVVFHDVRVVDGPDHVMSGEWFTVRITGEIGAGIRSSVDPVAIALRSLATGRVTFGTTSGRLGIDLSKPGEFQLEVRLQANVPAATYIIETSALDGPDAQEVAWGKNSMIKVSDPGTYIGTAQCNPEMRLLSLV